MSYFSKLKNLLNIESYKSLYTYSKGFRLRILIITVLDMIISLLGILTAMITKEIIDAAIASDIKKTFSFALLFVVILLLEVLFSSSISYLLVRIRANLRNRMQIAFIRAIFSKDWLKISKYNSGDLATHLYDDIQKIVQSITVSIPSLIALSLQLVLGFVYLAYYDMLLAIITLTITPVSIIISMLIGTRLKGVQKSIQDTESLHWSKTNESISNLTILKTFNYTDQAISDIQNIQFKKFILEKKRNFIMIKANMIMDLGYNVGFISAILIGAYRISMSAISFGTLAAFLQLVDRIQIPLESISKEIPSFLASFSSIERIQELHNLPDEVRPTETIPSDSTISHVILSNIDFSYDVNKPVLKKINMSIQLGEKIAIIGASGEGKTTLIDMLLALITPISGEARIHFTDHTSSKISTDTRQFFSYVSQTNMLFTGTIKENFLMTTEISEEQIQKALETSCCTDFINELDNGIDTLLLEDGLGLSQGQLQRISIARALLHNKPIVIFDEATSSLDPDTEKRLLASIKQNYPDITLIAITHRRELLSICDKTYLLEDHKLSLVTT